MNKCTATVPCKLTSTISAEFHAVGEGRKYSHRKMANGGQVAEIRGRRRSTWRMQRREGRQEVRKGNVQREEGKESSRRGKEERDVDGAEERILEKRKEKKGRGNWGNRTKYGEGRKERSGEGKVVER